MPPPELLDQHGIDVAITYRGMAVKFVRLSNSLLWGRQKHAQDCIRRLYVVHSANTGSLKSTRVSTTTHHEIQRI